MKIPALIIGLNVAALAIIRSLGERGVEVVVIDDDIRKPLARSKYIARLYEVDYKNEKRLREFLFDFGKSLAGNCVIFPIRDAEVRLVSKYRQELAARKYLFNLVDNDLLQDLMGKFELVDLAQKNKIDIPATYCIDHRAKFDSYINKIDFPWVIKPEYQLPGFKIDRPKTKEEAISIAEFLLKHKQRFIIQEWIGGPPSNIWFCLFYVSRGGDKYFFVGRKISQWSPLVGITSSAEGVFNEDVLAETKRIIDIFDYKGLGSTEFKFCEKTKRYKLFELTIGRMDFQLKTALANGINLPWLYYCDLSGIKLDIPVQQKNRYMWCDTGRHWKAIKFYWSYDRSYFKKLLAYTLFKRKVSSYFERRDPSPFFYRLKEVLVDELIIWFFSGVKGRFLRWIPKK